MSLPDGIASSVIDIKQVEDVPVLRPSARSFSARQAAELKRLVAVFKDKNILNMVIDLSSCDSISSEGLGAVSACWLWFGNTEGYSMGIVLPRKPGNEVVNLFDITGLSHAIGSALQRSVKDAVSYIRSFYPDNCGGG